MLSIEDLESLEETLDVMSNSKLVADIREALAELDTGAAQALSKDEARRLIAGQSNREYAVAWTASAQRALTRLPEKVATAVIEFLYGSLTANPQRVAKPLKLDFEVLRGDYRIIYRIDDTSRRSMSSPSSTEPTPTAGGARSTPAAGR